MYGPKMLIRLEDPHVFYVGTFGQLSAFGTAETCDDVWPTRWLEVDRHLLGEAEALTCPGFLSRKTPVASR